MRHLSAEEIARLSQESQERSLQRREQERLNAPLAPRRPIDWLAAALVVGIVVLLLFVAAVVVGTGPTP